MAFGEVGEDPIGRAKVEVRVGKLKNRKTAGKDEGTREILKGGGGRVLYWIYVMWPLRVVLCLRLDICCDCPTVQG